MDDSSVGSITFLYDRMKSGDDDAAAALWQKFSEKLAARANRRLEGRKAQRVVSGDDAVIDVFATVFRRAREGSFPEIDSREDLWRVLLTITDRKCSLMNRHYEADKRGGAINFLHTAGADSSTNLSPMDMLEDVVINRPEIAAAVTETFDHLMDILDQHDRELRLAEIAELRMSGWSNQDIAEKIDRSVKVVERRFKLIRELWQEWDVGGPNR